MPFVVNRRDGLFSLHKTAMRLCSLIVRFAPVIQRLYPENTALQVALTAALTACQALDAEVVAATTPGA